MKRSKLAYKCFLKGRLLFRESILGITVVGDATFNSLVQFSFICALSMGSVMEKLVNNLRH